MLVTAGPGTGKTNMLIQWIVYQIKNKGVSPGEIIAITFTNKAVDELRARLQKQIGSAAEKMLVGTFHAIVSVVYQFRGYFDPDTTHMIQNQIEFS